MSTKPCDGLTDAVGAVCTQWVGAVVGGGSGTAESMSDAGLIAVNNAMGMVQRHLDALRAPVAAEIAHRSRPELGAESLAKQQGFRNPIALIAATTGTSNGDAARLVTVGAATAPRMTFSGVAAAPKHPHVAEAMAHGRLTAQAAGAIVAMLTRVALRATADSLDIAERTLTRAAHGLSLDQLGKLIVRAEAHLDPDGLEPKEQDARGRRELRMFERSGMLHFNGCLDLEDGAPFKAVIEAFVSAEFRGAGRGLANQSNGAGLAPDQPSHVNGARGFGDDVDIDDDRRTLAQRRADALATMARHMMGCEQTDVPLDGATVIVRVRLEDLEQGIGFGTIDGITQPVSIGAVRRMAAGGGIIPCVLGGASEILDWGREKRLFTRAQKLALAERDGGCAMCALAPGMTRAHHVRFWARDGGPTDLGNGVLLCESCHHRIHDNGWEIRIDGMGVASRVWFIPPPHVDPTRAPRLGGRARYDYAA